MALTCPKCEEINKCDCKTCNPDGTATDLVIILEDEQLYQCCFCGHKFNEQDSLDFDWDRMIKDFSEKATPELCLEWRSLIQISPNDRKSLEKRIGIGEFGFEQAFRIHFNMNWNNCDIETFKKLKRDLKIKQIIDDKL
jgi:hypothetical protein